MDNHWQTLAEVESSIAGCLASLDRYEAAFSKVLAEGGPIAPSYTPEVWDAKLAIATQTTDDVEQLLAEQEGVWQRWQETLANWRGLVKQPA